MPAGPDRQFECVQHNSASLTDYVSETPATSLFSTR